MNNILNAIPKMKSGQELIDELSVFPPYDENIRSKSEAERLIALSDIYNVYVPSIMTTEIYSKLYLAILRSLQKKASRNAVIQQNKNHKAIFQQFNNGILGGSDAFTIISCSGLGKSCAINRSIELIGAEKVIETQNPYTKIIPCIVVQTPFDCSVKGLLLEILRKVDDLLHSDYYTKALKGRVTTDVLIGNVSQICLNHISLLIVDEIQNVVNSKNGKNLIGSLTQLINSSGISIAMIGTPESTVFFEQAMQLARRSIGLKYNAWEYNQFFRDFCSALLKYQYTRYKAEINESLFQWLYEHSGGILSVVVSLIHDSQEISILNGKEVISIETLNEAYKKRLTMLHSYIEPTRTKRKQTSTKQNQIDTYPLKNELSINDGFIIEKLVVKAKNESLDIVCLFREHFTVEVIKL